MARRVFVVSDLHLGGEPPCMMSRPGALADFLRSIPGRCRSDEVPHLVIAGDFLDFLAVPPFAAWTPDPAAAVAKLERTMGGPGRDGPFSAVFEALARHPGELDVLVGNHDLELALPEVQEALCRGLGRPVRFWDDGRALRVGGALIEHGNRYDGANVNDWIGLLYLRAARSRGLTPDVQVQVSAGSELVEQVVSPLKRWYPFIDLLQPAGELQLLLFLAFEPRLLADVAKVRRVVAGRAAELTMPARRAVGRQVQGLVTVPVAGRLGSDPALDAAFGRERALLHGPSQEVGAGDWLRLFLHNRKESVATLIREGRIVPDERLQQIQVVARRLLAEDAFRLDAPDGPYGEAARELQAAGAQVVVMGHTHLARVHGDPPFYLNTGTWADLVRFPEAALADDAMGRAELWAFLGRLLDDREVRSFEPHYADLRVEDDGRVARASLEVP